MKQTLMPYLRAAKMWRMRTHARREARRATEADRHIEGPAPRFIVGCGRSGTTILGKVFMLHPQVKYFFEPYHLWAEIDPKTDATSLYVKGAGSFVMDEADLTDQARLRFNRLIMRARADRRIIIEKTPHNVARLGYLEALSDHQARYLHIIRSGIDVARSIDRLASGNTYRMAGKGAYNQWWGTDEAKWHAIVRSGKARDCFAGEIDALTTHAQRGAYEWILSLSEADRWRDTLESRLLEIRYADLTAAVDQTLTTICTHFEVDAPDAWLAQARDMIGTERSNKGQPLQLPHGMCAAFNELQDRYEFEGRAEPL